MNIIIYHVWILNISIISVLSHIVNNLALEPYAMKVTYMVLTKGIISNNITYLDKPYTALLLLVIGYDITSFSA